MRPLLPHLRRLPVYIVVGAAILMACYGPIAQLPHYHQFADQRTLLGLPHAADVLSNLGFAVVGIWGFIRLWPQRHHPLLRDGWPGYCLFLLALIAVTFGSSYYHLEPDNTRLVWDRLPIALLCAGLLVAVRAETHAPDESYFDVILAALAAVLSVLWWYLTEQRGAGDLRPYLLLQAMPLVIIPLWHLIHDAPRADRTAFLLAILFYMLAKAAELGDHAIMAQQLWISGHTLKHLLSNMAAAVLVVHLVWRTREEKPAHPYRLGFIL